MRWVRYRGSEGVQYGVVKGETIWATSACWDDVLCGKVPSETGESCLLHEAKLLHPVPTPGKIVAIGQNYMDHCREQNTEPPETPLIFCKFTTALIGPGDEIRWSASLTNKVDLEAELAIVVGLRARAVPEDRALEYVLGYTCANDVSARDLQFGDKQWVRGKSLDTFCPLGPILVTRDEIRDPQALSIRSEINGSVMQSSSTSEMIFSVAHLVSYCSRSFTLEPGDVILSGTPRGVGVFRDPPVFLKDGDRVVIEIDRIGRLENRCVVG